MLVMHLSDIHCSYNSVKKLIEEINNSSMELNVILITGDIECPQTVLEPLISMKKKIPILAVTGNMDDIYVLEYLKDKNLLLENTCKIIHGKLIVCGISSINVKLSIQKLYLELINVSNISKNNLKLIILSHFPPFNTRVDITWSGVHAGLVEINNFIKKTRPHFLLCGHIHESRGIDRINTTIIVNPGPLAEGYYAIIDVLSQRVSLMRLQVL